MKRLSVPVSILVLGSALVLALWFGYAFVDLQRPVEKWGVFGDKFGALNCLFTGLAMVGVVAALWHEREQAEARDREQKDLVARLERQTAAMQSQAEAIGEAARIEALGRRIDRYQAHLNRLAEPRKGYTLNHAAIEALAIAIKKMEDELDRAIGVPIGIRRKDSETNDH